MARRQRDAAGQIPRGRYPVLDAAAHERRRIVRVGHHVCIAKTEAGAARESKAAFAVRRQPAVQRRARLQRHRAEVHTHMMRIGIARPHARECHVVERPHVARLRGKDAVELAADQHHADVDARHLDRRRVESGLQRCL